MTRYNNNSRVWLCAGVAASVLLGAVTSTPAAFIVSEEFSLGFGASEATEPTWSTSETSDVNTPTTIGDFTFLPTVTGATTGNRGPTFFDRVLEDGGENLYTGSPSTFSVSIAASYHGTAVPDNPYIRVIIDEISVYGAKWDGGDRTLAFRETTPGYEGQSDAVTLIDIGRVHAEQYKIANYTQLNWNPDDWWVAGTEFTRSFDVVHENGDPWTTVGFLDGFEIRGRVEIVPEPGTASMLLVGGIAVVLAMSRRKRRTG